MIHQAADQTSTSVIEETRYGGSASEHRGSMVMTGKHNQAHLFVCRRSLTLRLQTRVSWYQALTLNHPIM